MRIAREKAGSTTKPRLGEKLRRVALTAVLVGVAGTAVPGNGQAEENAKVNSMALEY